MVDLAATIDAAPEGARLRTGRIVRLLGAQQVVVDVGGGELVNMPCLAVDPILGDVVQILQQGPVQVVLGRTAPLSADDVLANPSFELDNVGDVPSYWTKVLGGGSPATNIKTDNASGWGSITGERWLEINQQAAGDTTVFVVSEAIPVQAGELWTAAAWTMNSSLTFDGGFAEIYLTWYMNDTDMYPTTSAADHVIQGVVFPPGGTPGWFLLRELIDSGVEVPPGITYMRVVLVSYLSNDLGASAYWDAVVCRKLRGV